jgi:hypothetical protein
MGSLYVSVFDGISTTTAAELFYLKPSSTRAVVIHEVRITQETDEASQQLPLKLYRTATDSSANGTANTPAPLNPNAAASVGATVRTHVAAGTSAETTVLRVEAENVLGGWQYLPTPETRIVVPAGGNGFVVKLKTAPGGSGLTLSGFMIFEEIG